MIFYFSVALIILIEAFILLFARLGKKGLQLFLWIVALELWVIIGLRSYHIGVDSITYYEMYIFLLDISGLFSVFTHMEPGFIILNKSLGFLSTSPQLLFMVAAAFTVGATFRLIYFNKYYAWLSVIIFIFIDQLPFDMAAMRQSIALGCLFLSYPFIIKRQLIPFLLLVGLAMTFHVSAVCFIIVYPLRNMVFKFKYLIGGIIGAGVAFLFFPPFLNIFMRILPKYTVYIDTFYFTQGIKLASILKTIMAAMIFIFSYCALTRGGNRYILFEKADLRIHANLQLFISLISCIIMFLSIRSVLVERLAFYFYFFNIILLPLSVKMIKNPLIRLIACVAIVCIAVLYFSVIVIYRPEWWQNVPYQFFWEV